MIKRSDIYKAVSDESEMRLRAKLDNVRADHDRKQQRKNDVFRGIVFCGGGMLASALIMYFFGSWLFNLIF